MKSPHSKLKGFNLPLLLRKLRRPFDVSSDVIKGEHPRRQENIAGKRGTSQTGTVPSLSCDHNSKPSYPEETRRTKTGLVVHTNHG